MKTVALQDVPTVMRTPARRPTGEMLANAASLLLQRAAAENDSMIRTLHTLFENQPVLRHQGDTRLQVRSLCIDSRRVAPGAVFFAMPGLRTDGNRYIDEAVARGAVAVVSEQNTWVPRKTTFFQVEDIRASLAESARRFFGHPQASLDLVGITGTSGKTVVATLLRHFLESEEAPVGLLGTIHYSLGRRTLPAFRTTPDAIDLHAMLAQMRDAGCREAVLEVSSHAVVQGRVNQLPIKTAAFLNLTPEHLDYHGTMEAYYQAKKALFDGSNGPLPQNAVINLDDPYGRRLIQDLPDSVSYVTFGTVEGSNYRAREVVCSDRDARFLLEWPGGSARVVSPLIGRGNVSNVLAAMALAHQHGREPEALIARLFEFEGVRGRMERVDAGQSFNVVIDYAHTPEGYTQALETLRALTPGRLISVFGCGGNRDRSHRPAVLRAVADGSDRVIVTADNPRSEAVSRIFDDMRPGLKVGDQVDFIEDRRRAIHQALSEARAGDTVLVGGKGHETFQEFADSVVPFDDRSVVRDLLRKMQSSPESVGSLLLRG